MTRPNLMIGQMLGGRYRIDEILGQGGMSAVYKAFDPNLKRVVAVKMIHAHLADDPRFVARFEEEAAAVAQLRHPNIVQVFDFNHDGDLYYMIQEFIPGETLQQRLRRLHQANRRMPLTEAIQVTREIAEAAGYAHVRGLIHRDIKPANIMLNIHSQAILMDFGIVKIAGGDRHTATGAVVGTALYMAPEMIRGEVPDARADIYSLGITLFEMVCGKPPFEADSAMTLMMMHLNDPLPDLRPLRPEVPEALIAVIETALQKDKHQRYPSMQAFAEALAGLRLPQATGEQATVVDASLASAAVPEATQPPQPVPAPAAASQRIQPQMKGEAAAAPASQPDAASEATLAQPAISARADSPAQNTDLPVRAAEVAPEIGKAKRSFPIPGGNAPLALWIGLGALLLISLVVGGVWLFGGGNKSAPPPDSGAPATLEISESGQTTAVALVLPTQTPEPSPTMPPAASETPPSATATPEIQATPTMLPTPTIPPGVRFVDIQSITTDTQGRYVVEYETFEYTEKLPGVHVHFFFDTVPPEQAGNPGKGPWYLYGGPRPFDKYRQKDRPKEAAQMCALVANADHSVQLNSGDCAVLPDVPAVIPLTELACRQGPGETYPTTALVAAYQARPEAGARLALGISPDEAWWSVAIPGRPGESCWLPRNGTMFSGDISSLPLIQPPESPGASGSGLAVEITGISLNAQNRYVVEYVTRGFTEQLPGTHIHFFFDIYQAEQVGNTGGNRLMYGGPSPFAGYIAAYRPTGAAQLCALVANPDHSVIAGSGNCFALPGAP